MSASDSNFVAAKKNGFACSGRGDYDLPRLILIFVAAKKNGFACRTTPQRRVASILDFMAKLGNRCKETLKNSPKAASILDFRLRLGNRCSVIAAAAKNSPPAAPS